jgi:hypothetical protein
MTTARIVAPDAADADLELAAEQRQAQRLACLEAIQLVHRLADPYRDAWRGNGHHRPGEGQACGRIGPIHFAHQQRHGRPLRVEAEGAGGRALDPGEGCVPLLQRGQQFGG